MAGAFKQLARLKGLRGTPFDVFGHSRERKTERQLIVDYETLLHEIIDVLRPDNHALTVDLAALPDEIRGFGHVKEQRLAEARARQAELLAAFRSPPGARAEAAE